VPENFGSAGYTIFVGDARETIQLSGQTRDVIHVTAASGLASVTDRLQGGFNATGTEQVDGGGLVGLSGGPVVGVGTLLLAQPTHIIYTGTANDLTRAAPAPISST